MYTANTMASAIEALGMSLPYDSSIPAEDPLKRDECRMAGRCEAVVGRGGASRCGALLEVHAQGRTGAAGQASAPAGKRTARPLWSSAGGGPIKRVSVQGAAEQCEVGRVVGCRYMLELLKRDLKPRDIMTFKAFENAMVLTMALGGSTNAVLHFIAMARRVGGARAGCRAAHSWAGLPPHSSLQANSQSLQQPRNGRGAQRASRA